MISLILLMIFQILVVIAVAPLFDGIARKLRAKFQSRIGPSIFQTYLDIAKLIKRGRTHPNCATYIFKISPYLLCAITATMLALLPITYAGNEKAINLSDILVLIYLSAMFRFVFTIASSDTGGALTGIGGSRENTIGFYVEPVLILTLGVVMLKAQTTSLLEINELVRSGNFGYTTPSFAIASIAFLWAMYVEMGRKPYDLAEAEQELQEGLLGEFSGKDFAVAKLALMLKQWAMIGFFITIFEPWNFTNPLLAILVFVLEAGILYVLAIFIDNFGPRFKILKGAKFGALMAFLIALISVVLYIIGA